MVNDSHGHDAGDIVLCETARRLLAIVRGADIVARLGGDEFVIVYEPNDPSSDNLVSRLEDASVRTNPGDNRPFGDLSSEHRRCRHPSHRLRRRGADGGGRRGNVQGEEITQPRQRDDSCQTLAFSRPPARCVGSVVGDGARSLAGPTDAAPTRRSSPRSPGGTTPAMPPQQRAPPGRGLERARRWPRSIPRSSPTSPRCARTCDSSAGMTPHDRVADRRAVERVDARRRRDPRARARAGAALAAVQRADRRRRRRSSARRCCSRSARCSPTCRTPAPVQLIGTATDQTLIDRFELQRSRYEGPTGIVGVLHDAFAAARHAVGLAVGRGARLRLAGAVAEGGAGARRAGVRDDRAAPRRPAGWSTDAGEYDARVVGVRRRRRRPHRLRRPARVDGRQRPSSTTTTTRTTTTTDDRSTASRPTIDDEPGSTATS